MVVNKTLNTHQLKVAVFHNLPSGGARRVLDDLYPYISKKYTVDKYTLPVFKFNNFLHQYWFVLFKLPSIHKKVALEIDNGRYDLVFVHHDYFTKSPYLLRYLKTRSVYFCHEEPREFYNDRQYFSTNLKYWFVNILRYPLKIIDYQNVIKANVVLTNSKFSEKKLKRIYNRKITYIKLGIDTNKFVYTQVDKTQPFYLTVGATAKFKGIDFLIKSISKLPRIYQYPLVIVGNKGRDYGKIISIARAKEVNIILKSSISDDELVRLYNSAKLLLAAAVNEPLGLFIIEALSCGLSVVAVNEGGYKEIVKSKNLGYLVDRDEYYFSQAMIKRLSFNEDKQKMHSFIEKNWKWELTINQLDKIFHESLR